VDLNIDQLPSAITTGNNDQNNLREFEISCYKEHLAQQLLNILAWHNSHFPISVCSRISSPIKVIKAQYEGETFLTLGSDVLYQGDELWYFLSRNDRR